MVHVLARRTLLALFVVSVFLSSSTHAQQFQFISQTFTSAAGQTAWELYVEQKFGLTVRSARFMRKPGDWVHVLYEAQLSQMLVPYYDGSPRYWDLHSTSGLDILSSADAGTNGQLLNLDGQPRVVRELRDIGLTWREPGDSANVRRGQALIVWGTVSVGQYCYVIQYSFHDDGSITMRVGSTGHLQHGMAKHTHTALWRIDMDLGTAHPNSVAIMEHQEPADDALQAESLHATFGNGKEGFADWNAHRFTMLHVVSDDTHISYDLMTMRGGSARHFDEDEHCTQHDFWVSRYRSDEIDYQAVSRFVDDKESIEKSDVVLWCASSMPHEPRRQDSDITYAMWTGLEMRPRDLFERAPHYPAMR
jgi:primary-amine oxidase